MTNFLTSEIKNILSNATTLSTEPVNDLDVGNLTNLYDE